MHAIVRISGCPSLPPLSPPSPATSFPILSTKYAAAAQKIQNVWLSELQKVFQFLMNKMLLTIAIALTQLSECGT